MSVLTLHQKIKMVEDKFDIIFLQLNEKKRQFKLLEEQFNTPQLNDIEFRKLFMENWIAYNEYRCRTFQREQEQKDIRDEIEVIMSEIKKEANLREIEPNFNVIRIKKLNSVLNNINYEKIELNLPYPLLCNPNLYELGYTKRVDFFWTNYCEDFLEKKNQIQKKLDNLSLEVLSLKEELTQADTMIKDIKTLLKKDEWIEKYREYALLNNLYDMEEIDDDNIFRVCNLHHMNKLLYNFKVDCTCNAECDIPNNAEKEHHIEYYNDCCTYGTRAMIFPKKKKVINFIGFIECDNITNFCTVNIY
jgi:hypothetical protein